LTVQIYSFFHKPIKSTRKLFQPVYRVHFVIFSPIFRLNFLR